MKNMKSLYVTLVNAKGRRSLIVVFFFCGTITVLDSAHESGIISFCLMILFNAHVKDIKLRAKKFKFNLLKIKLNSYLDKSL